MLELRTKLNVKMKNETMNLGMEFNKGMSVVGLIVNLLIHTPVDLVDAKERINKVIDRELEIKHQQG